MSSLAQKLRNMLEASWAVSPTLVGLACIRLDLAALLHLRMKTQQPCEQTIRERRPSE
jgi:hypothetical protein